MPRSEIRIWPTEIQQRAQAMFDAERGLFVADYPQFHRFDSDGELVPFCGECGLVRSLNPENDLCSHCEDIIRQALTMEGEGD